MDTLFDFAIDQVPRLASKAGLRQEPIKAVPGQGRSFVIGRLTDDVRQVFSVSQQILVVRSLVMDMDALDDALGLSALLDEALMDAAHRDGGFLTFVDSARVEGAYRISGSYRLQGETLVARFKLRRDDRTVAEFELESEGSDGEELVGQVVRTVEREIQRQSAQQGVDGG